MNIVLTMTSLISSVKEAVSACSLRRTRGRFLALIFVFSLPLSLVGSCDLSQNALGILQAQAALNGNLITVEDAPMTARETRRYAGTLEKLLMRDAHTLLSLAGDDLRLVLDEPELKRQEGAVQVWQYRSSACVLDVYVSQPDFVVSHYEMRERTKARLGVVTNVQVPADLERCFGSVIADVKRARGSLFAALIR